MDNDVFFVGSLLSAKSSGETKKNQADESCISSWGFIERGKILISQRDQTTHSLKGAQNRSLSYLSRLSALKARCLSATFEDCKFFGWSCRPNRTFIVASSCIALWACRSLSRFAALCGPLPNPSIEGLKWVRCQSWQLLPAKESYSPEWNSQHSFEIFAKGSVLLK